ncbi:MAG: hypothetical protein K0Q79_2569 [Flavipsychrobacter sp.]|jgi:sugar lactone lactonase YvrE|nr:hypothetical protein [Flavipsychrobacter sp.]
MKKYLLAAFVLSSFLHNATAQNIYTYAGTGAASFSGDGGAATAAAINLPSGVITDGSGNVYIADDGNYRVRKVNSSGIISTIAGDGTSGFSGDGGPATAARFLEPFDLCLDVAGNVYVVDRANHRVRKISTSGIITTVAGDGTASSGGDGLPATTAQLYAPSGVVFDASGNMYITEANGHRIRKVNTSGVISTVAGTGTAGFSGDGGAATAAMINGPLGLTLDGAGNIFVGEVGGRRVRKISTAGIITTIAGNGTSGSSGDGGPATAALLNNPGNVAFDAAGNLYIADGLGCKIRKVNTAGIISTYVGTGVCGFSGDGGPATAAKVDRPASIAFASDGSAYIADWLNDRIRKIPAPPSTGISAYANDELSMFPNPATNELSIIASPFTYRSFSITGIAGNTVMQQPVIMELNVVPIAQLPPGIYFIRLQKDDGVVVRKFVKQ